MANTEEIDGFVDGPHTRLVEVLDQANDLVTWRVYNHLETGCFWRESAWLISAVGPELAWRLHWKKIDREFKASGMTKPEFRTQRFKHFTKYPELVHQANMELEGHAGVWEAVWSLGVLWGGPE